MFVFYRFVEIFYEIGYEFKRLPYLLHVYKRIYLNSMATYPKKLNGLCVGVPSGDRVLFQGPVDKENGGFKQKFLHLSAIVAPKVDAANGKDEKFGFAAREFLRTRLVGKDLPFVVERKVGEIEVGYVLFEGKDISIDLLTEGLVKLRSDKINCDHIEDYRNAEVDAQMGERGLWSLENKPKGADRYLKLTWNDKEFYQSFKGKAIRAVVEEIHPSKVVLYSQELGWIGTVNYSQVQVVVLSEKQESGEKQSNVRAIRSTIESVFLNREVDVFITGLGQGLSGFITSGNEDIRKILLRNGYAKLGKEAIKGISTKEFMELKMIAQQALEEGKGLWKEQKVVKGETLNSKSYMGVVCEVNSGDSLTVCNDKNQFNRIYLPNIRGPAQNQPFAFESKEGLRRRVIGCKVRVEVEFSRKITVKKFEGDIGELKNFIFASVFENNQNISVYLLENGFVSLQTPRVEEDVTKYFDALRDAEAKGKKDRKGINSGNESKPINFNDLSGGKGKKIDAGRCKNIFPFLKDEKTLTGVIDLVLNGSRFKVRFNQQSILAIMVLEGVRCLPNEGAFAKASEEALQYSKLHANQRDVEIQLKSVDLKGIFHGKVLINKKDYALELLERGLAVCMGGKYRNARYEEAESLARKNKIGLWKYNLNLTSIKGEMNKEFKAINMTKTLTLLEIVSAEQFYLEPENAKRPNVPQDPKPVGPIEVGSLYACKFTADETFYRAKVVRDLGNKYHVCYIDYGNFETIGKDRFGQLPEELKGAKSPLYRCGLFGVEAVTKEGLNILKDYTGVQLKVEFKEELVPQGPRDEIEYRVILTEKEECVNLQLIQLGQGQCSCENEVWRKAEEKARQTREGKWATEDD